VVVDEHQITIDDIPYEEDEEVDSEDQQPLTVGEALEKAQADGVIIDIPPRRMSESQAQGYDAFERYYALVKYDPEEVAKAFEPDYDRERYDKEVDRTAEVLGWMDRYYTELLRKDEEALP